MALAKSLMEQHLRGRTFLSIYQELSSASTTQNSAQKNNCLCGTHKNSKAVVACGTLQFLKTIYRRSI